MTPLRQRMIEDMRIRNFADHYAAKLCPLCRRVRQILPPPPAELDLEAVRQYQLFLTQERNLSPQSINTFVSAVQFLLPGHPGDALGKTRLSARPPGRKAPRRPGPRWKSNASSTTSPASNTAPSC